jgi:hypothetical protein
VEDFSMLGTDPFPEKAVRGGAGLREMDKEFIELDLCRSTDESSLPNESGFQKARIFLEAVKLQTDGSC